MLPFVRISALVVVLCTPSALGADATVVSVPELFTRQPGHFVEGHFGQALWHHSQAHGLGYPVAAGAPKLEAGTISLWVKLTRPRWTYEHQQLLRLTDGAQAIVLHVYSGHPEPTKLRPRRLWVSVDNAPNRPKRWFHASHQLAPDFHSGFHHVLFTWRRGESTTYLDGEAIGHATDAKGWFDPLDGNALRVSLTSSGVWFDDVTLLRRHTDAAQAKDIAAGGPWAVDQDTALHLSFDGWLAGKAAIPPNASGVSFACYTDTTDNHFLADDPLRVRVRVVNFDAAACKPRLRLRVENLAKQVAFESSQDLAIDARSAVDTAVDLALQTRGLFWADAELVDANGKSLAHERVPLAVTVGPDVSQHPAEDIPNGIVVSQSSRLAPGQKWAGFEYLSSWRDLELEPGQWDFTVLDMVVAEALASGREPHLMFYGSPDWQSTGDPKPAHFNRRQWAAPRDNAAWVDYVQRLTKRFKGKVRTYEVWNEPYWNDPSGGYFYGTAERYAELVRLASDAVHEVDPAARVVCGFGGPRGWCDKVARLTAGKPDLYGTHPYNMATNLDADEATVLTLRDLLRQHRARTRLANTEISDKQLNRWAVRADGRPMTREEFDRDVDWNALPSYYRKLGRDAFCDHFTSAAMLVRSHVMSLAAGCEYILWWNYSPGVPATTFKANTPSLQSAAYANFAGMVAGHRFVQRLDLGAPYLKAYLFAHKRTGQSVLAAWADREPETVHLNVGSDAVEALDLWGNAVAAQRVGPLLSLPLTRSPVYVRGLASSPQLSRPLLSVRPAAAFVFPGQRAKLLVSMANPLPRPLAGTLRVKLPEGFAKVEPQRVRIAAQQASELPVEIAVPDTAAGGQPATVTLETDAGELGTATRRLLLPVRLAASAQRVGAPRQTDGDLRDWGPAERFPIRIDRAEQVVIGTPYTAVHDDPTLKCDWRGGRDLRLAAAVAYDMAYLYFAVRVWDDAVVNSMAATRPPLAYQGDCVELFLDARKPQQQGQAAYAPEVFHLMLAPPVEGFPAPMLHVSAPRHGKLAAVAIDAQRLADGYAIELRIPLSNFPSVAFEPGASLGLDLAVDDADDPAAKRRKSQLVWAGDASDHADASKFGRLMLW